MVIQLVNQLFRGAAPTVSTTLFTNTTGQTTVASTFVVVNTAATAATYSLLIGGIEYIAALAIPANTTHIYDNVRQVLTGTQVIAGFASAATVKFHLSGVVS